MLAVPKICWPLKKQAFSHISPIWGNETAKTSEGYGEVCLYLFAMVFKICNNSAPPDSTSLLITVPSLDQQYEHHQDLVWNAEPQAPPGPSAIKICFFIRCPGDWNAMVQKAKLLLCRIYFSVMLLAFCLVNPIEGDLLPLYSAYEKSTNELGILVGQISHCHWSINAAFSCNYWTSLLPRCF